MKVKDLKDRIDGTILKKEYLEAFLLQGTYIEGIVKRLVEFNFYSHFLYEKEDNLSDGARKMTDALWDRIGKFGFFEAIQFLADSEFITTAQKNQLDEYRKSRNRVVHGLMSEIRREEFEANLSSSCKLGSEIINSNYFSKIEELFMKYEKRLEKKIEKVETDKITPAG